MIALYRRMRHNIEYNIYVVHKQTAQKESRASWIN